MPKISQAARFGAALATASVLLAGCGTATDATTAPTSGDAAAQVPPPAVSTEPATPDQPATADQPAPQTSAPVADAPVDVPEQLDFAADTVDGASFDGRSLAGRDALVYFWAPWCAICRREAPALPELVNGYPDLAFVTVGGSSPDPDAMADFVDDVGFGDFTNVADLSGDVWSRFAVTYQPTYAFVDDSGTVEMVSGPLDKADLGERIDALLAS